VAAAALRRHGCQVGMAGLTDVGTAVTDRRRDDRPADRRRVGLRVAAGGTTSGWTRLEPFEGRRSALSAGFGQSF
jgi:hypothetical protein